MASSRSARPTGPVKTAIFGGNNARLYNIDPKRAMLELQQRPLPSAQGGIREGGAGAHQSALRRAAGTEPPVDYSLFA